MLLRSGSVSVSEEGEESQPYPSSPRRATARPYVEGLPGRELLGSEGGVVGAEMEARRSSEGGGRWRSEIERRREESRGSRFETAEGRRERRLDCGGGKRDCEGAVEGRGGGGSGRVIVEDKAGAAAREGLVYGIGDSMVAAQRGRVSGSERGSSISGQLLPPVMVS